MSEWRSRWRTFAEWNQDPNFWRGIYANVVSALVVGAIVFVLALLAGYVTIHRTGAARAAGYIGAAIVWIIAFSIVERRPATSRRRWRWWLVWLVTTLIAAVGLGEILTFLINHIGR